MSGTDPDAAQVPAIEAATIDTGTLTINSVSKSIPGTLDSNTAVQT